MRLWKGLTSYWFSRSLHLHAIHPKRAIKITPDRSAVPSLLGSLSLTLCAKRGEEREQKKTLPVDRKRAKEGEFPSFPPFVQGRQRSPRARGHKKTPSAFNKCILVKKVERAAYPAHFHWNWESIACEESGGAWQIRGDRFFGFLL